MPRPWRALVLLPIVVRVLAGCVTPKPPEEPALTLAEVQRRLPDGVQDPGGWGRDILAALEAIDQVPTTERVCAAVAVIGQESGFQADPPVSGLPRIVRTALLRRVAALGPLAEPALKFFLAAPVPGSRETFGQRVESLKTEHDLDRLFRDIRTAVHQGLPGPYALASALTRIFGKADLDEVNPVTTVGAMQVQVGFARKLAETRSLDDDELREYLYTRSGGVKVGIARLLGYEAHYDAMQYRFADYNVGVLASRNAEFQALLADLTGQKLALDGDLLAYGADGEPDAADSKTLHAMLTFGKMQGDWLWLIRRAARAEKSVDFEDKAIWRDVRDAWAKKHGKQPPYARLPEVAVASPKMEQERSTAWFAKSVQRRYAACKGRR